MDTDLLKRSPEYLLHLTYNEAFTLSSDEVSDIQLSALQLRFNSLLPKVPLLRKVADEQNLTEIVDLADAARLLIPHSIYKSYPLSLLENNRFDRLTRWLNSLTSYDLLSLDMTDCTGIDDWLDKLDQRTELRLKHSSGTTGKLSFIPRAHPETEHIARSWPRFFEGFGDEPNGSLPDFDEMPIVYMSYRRGALAMARLMQAVVEFNHGGDESAVLASDPGRLSADIMSLGGRLNAAQLRGEVGRLQISADLAKRREAFIEEQRTAPERMGAFFETLDKEVRGKRVVVVGSTVQLFDLSLQAEKRGISQVFAPDSIVSVGGGTKGRDLPENFQESIAAFTGVTVGGPQGYGMTEMTGAGARMCPNHNYHPRPHIVCYLLDPHSGALLPRKGRQTGRFGFVDLVAFTHWSGFLTGDELTFEWDGTCACGRNGPYFYPTIRRYSEAEGGDDKITCAGAPEVHDKALDFLSKITG